MLKEARTNLLALALELPDYPHEGDMGRSYLLRNIGASFMPIFIAFGRIKSEMESYVPNHAKIKAFFDEYPGMAGSSIQTVMKREGVSSDAYRVVESISINPDGTYANAAQFRTGLEEKMAALCLAGPFKDELRSLLDPRNLVTAAEAMTVESFMELNKKIALRQEQLARQFVY